MPAIPALIVSTENLKSLRAQIRAVYDIPSSHLSEALAAALGFNTYAALLARITSMGNDEIIITLEDDKFESRLSDLGHSLDRDWRGFSSFISSIVINQGDKSPHIRANLKKSFSMVWNLWVFPDFSRVMAGKEVPPWINHDKVDFEFLRSVLADEFRFGDPVNIRLGNDTIDQTVIQFREEGILPGPFDCVDFSAALLKKSKTDSRSIVDIRSDWYSLHHLKDRTNAPPPIILPILVDSHDAEANVLWARSAKFVMGMRAASHEYPFLPASQHQEGDHEGTLSIRLRKALTKEFKIRFMPNVSLSLGASDPKPAWLQQAEKLKDLRK